MEDKLVRYVDIELDKNGVEHVGMALSSAEIGEM